MSLEPIEKVISKKLSELKKKGMVKGEELVITGIKKGYGNKGPRYLVQGEGKKEFIKMNSNSYLGMSLEKRVIKAEKEAVEKFGVGPGAVRFIHGTFRPHRDLEQKLASFHRKQACMIFSSAYAAVCGILPPLLSSDTIVLSDALNHNCIINAMKLSKPKEKKIYLHLDMDNLEEKIRECFGECKRVIIVTDGVFSMRGDYPDLRRMVALARKYGRRFDEGILTVMDDSHGVGAYGKTGRGTCEVTGERGVDIIVSTLGKSLGVNGGYVATGRKIVKYLRETAPLYLYSNPITPSEASAALAGIEILAGKKGVHMLKCLSETTAYFRHGLTECGYETIQGEHPIVPAMIRDTGKTVKLVNYLKSCKILAIGLKYPVVPKGDECIRFQISASHTRRDIDYVLKVLARGREICGV